MHEKRPAICFELNNQQYQRCMILIFLWLLAKYIVMIDGKLSHIWCVFQKCLYCHVKMKCPESMWHGICLKTSRTEYRSWKPRRIWLIRPNSTVEKFGFEETFESGKHWCWGYSSRQAVAEFSSCHRNIQSPMILHELHVCSSMQTAGAVEVRCRPPGGGLALSTTGLFMSAVERQYS
jgi:hypothetical protein